MVLITHIGTYLVPTLYLSWPTGTIIRSIRVGEGASDHLKPGSRTLYRMYCCPIHVINSLHYLGLRVHPIQRFPPSILIRSTQTPLEHFFRHDCKTPTASFSPWCCPFFYHLFASISGPSVFYSDVGVIHFLRWTWYSFYTLALRFRCPSTHSTPLAPFSFFLHTNSECSQPNIIIIIIYYNYNSRQKIIRLPIIHPETRTIQTEATWIHNSTISSISTKNSMLPCSLKNLPDPQSLPARIDVADLLCNLLRPIFHHIHLLLLPTIHHHHPMLPIIRTSPPEMQDPAEALAVTIDVRLRLLLLLRNMTAEDTHHLLIHQALPPRIEDTTHHLLLLAIHPTMVIIQNSGKDTMLNHHQDLFQKKMESPFHPPPRRLAENTTWTWVELPKSCHPDLPFSLPMRLPRRLSFEDRHRPFNHRRGHSLELLEALECWILHPKPCKTFRQWDHSTPAMESSTWTILRPCCHTMLPILPFWICKIHLKPIVDPRMARLWRNSWLRLRPLTWSFTVPSCLLPSPLWSYNRWKRQQLLHIPIPTRDITWIRRESQNLASFGPRRMVHQPVEAAVVEVDLLREVAAVPFDWK